MRLQYLLFLTLLLISPVFAAEGTPWYFTVNFLVSVCFFFVMFAIFMTGLTYVLSDSSKNKTADTLLVTGIAISFALPGAVGAYYWDGLISFLSAAVMFIIILAVVVAAVAMIAFTKGKARIFAIIAAIIVGIIFLFILFPTVFTFNSATEQHSTESQWTALLIPAAIVLFVIFFYFIRQVLKSRGGTFFRPRATTPAGNIPPTIQPPGTPPGTPPTRPPNIPPVNQPPGTPPVQPPNIIPPTTRPPNIPPVITAGGAAPQTSLPQTPTVQLPTTVKALAKVLDPVADHANNARKLSAYFDFLGGK